MWLPAMLLFFVPLATLVLTDFNYSNPAYAAQDQRGVHLPAVEFFANHWGQPDLRNYYSSDTPGYYFLFGGVRRWLTSSVVALRFLNLLLTVGLIVTFAWAVTRYCPSPLAVFLALPFMFSDSVVTRGLWLSTDNPAWWGVLAALVLSLRTPALLPAALITLGVAGVRQIHIWIVALLICAAFIGRRNKPRLERAAFQRAGMMTLAIAPAVLMVGWFAFQWHGLVPPRLQSLKPGLNFAPFPMTFALLAMFGPFFATAFWSRLQHRWKRHRRFLAVGLVLGIVAGLAPDAYYLRYYRANGIWLLTRYTPLYHGHSPIILVLSTIGGLVLGALWTVLNRRDRWIFTVALFTFIIAQCATLAVYERYYEPFILMLLALAASRIPTPQNWLRAAVGPAVLAVILACYTVWMLSQASA